MKTTTDIITQLSNRSKWKRGIVMARHLLKLAKQQHAWERDLCSRGVKLIPASPHVIAQLLYRVIDVLFISGYIVFEHENLRDEIVFPFIDKAIMDGDFDGFIANLQSAAIGDFNLNYTK